MFAEGGGLQECVLAQVNTVPGRAGESLREQVRAERAPKCAPIPTETSAALSPKNAGLPAAAAPTAAQLLRRDVTESRRSGAPGPRLLRDKLGGARGRPACPSRTVIRSQDPYFRFTPRTMPNRN